VFWGPYTPSTTSKLYMLAREVVAHQSNASARCPMHLEWGIMWPWSDRLGWSPHSRWWGWACRPGAGWGTYRITMSWSSQFEVFPLDKPYKSSDSDGASTRLASADAWACGDGSPSRRNTSKLRHNGGEVWRSDEVSTCEIWKRFASEMWCVGRDQFFWCAAKTSGKLLGCKPH
jgi:hypothetical protein